jgi:Pectate lyase superfamily protein
LNGASSKSESPIHPFLLFRESNPTTMKHAPRLLVLALCATVFCAQSRAQTSSQPKCDGATDDTSAIQSAINAAAARHEKLQLPAGTCLTNATAILLPDNSVLQGAGKTATVIRRKDSVDAKTNMFTLVGKTGTVTISDLTIDYNRSHQATGSDTIGTSATTITNFILQRTRLINGWKLAVWFLYPPGRILSDILIADNDFENNGHGTELQSDIFNGDIFIAPVMGLRILNNHANNTQGSFFVSGTGGNPSGMGKFVITGNVVTKVLGFGIALGGGGPDPAGGTDVTIRDNTFKMSSTRENVIDVAYWSDVVIDHNYMESGTCNASCGAVGDAPPGNKITVTNNTIIASPAAPTNNCVGLGGSEEVITGNTCSNAGGAGIVLVGDVTPAHGSLIANNVVKNCNQARQGDHAGIALYLPPGGRMSDVMIRGNHVYDDRGRGATQLTGIAVGSGVSNPAGFANITVENNDVHQNHRGILNNTRGSTNIVIRQNDGH